MHGMCINIKITYIILAKVFLYSAVTEFRIIKPPQRQPIKHPKDSLYQ